MPDDTPDPTPAAGGLPWRAPFTAIDLPTTVLRGAQAADARDLTGEHPLGWLHRPDDDIASSWLHQVTLVRHDGITVRLQARLEVEGFAAVAGDQHADRPMPAWPLAEPVLILGAVRGPCVTYPAEAAASQEGLVRRLGRVGVRAIAATTLDRAHGWVEPAVVATRGELDGQPVESWQGRALEIARRLGITTVVRVQDGTWQVLALAEGAVARVESQSVVACSITRDQVHRCPMQYSPEAGQYCPMRGGPWTSSSIHAAAGWRHHRDALVAAVGCDTCEGVRYLFQGEVRTSGGPITVVTSPMATRWLAPSSARLDLEGLDDDA